MTSAISVCNKCFDPPGQHSTPMVLWCPTAYPPVNMKMEHASFLHSPIKREMLPLQHLSPNLSSFIHIYLYIVHTHIYIYISAVFDACPNSRPGCRALELHFLCRDSNRLGIAVGLATWLGSPGETHRFHS